MHKSAAEAQEEVTDTPSFRTQLANLVQGQRVRVESAAGKRFEGLFEDVSLEEHHVLLRDAEELPGGVKSPIAFVASVDWIAQVDNDTE